MNHLDYAGPYLTLLLPLTRAEPDLTALSQASIGSFFKEITSSWKSDIVHLSIAETCFERSSLDAIDEVPFIAYWSEEKFATGTSSNSDVFRFSYLDINWNRG